ARSGTTMTFGGWPPPGRRANVVRTSREAKMLRPLRAALCAVLFAGCASTGTGTGGRADAPAAPSGEAATAFTSTYRPIAAPPVLITGATVLTGVGRRLAN